MSERTDVKRRKVVVIDDKEFDPEVVVTGRVVNMILKATMWHDKGGEYAAMFSPDIQFNDDMTFESNGKKYSLYLDEMRVPEPEPAEAPAPEVQQRPQHYAPRRPSMPVKAQLTMEDRHAELWSHVNRVILNDPAFRKECVDKLGMDWSVFSKDQTFFIRDRKLALVLVECDKNGWLLQESKDKIPRGDHRGRQLVYTFHEALSKSLSIAWKMIQDNIDFTGYRITSDARNVIIDGTPHRFCALLADVE